MLILFFTIFALADEPKKIFDPNLFNAGCAKKIFPQMTDEQKAEVRRIREILKCDLK